MAEPLGIIGVIGVATQLIQLAAQLGLDWADAPAEGRTLVLELQTLRTILSETHTNTLFNPDFVDAFHGRRSALLSEFDPLNGDAASTPGLLAACSRELTSLLADLRKRAQSNGSSNRLRWERLKAAFTSRRTRDAVADLRRRCAALNELLQIDVAAIAARTHAEVRDGRREQRQQHHAQARALDHLRERLDGQDGREEGERARREREEVLAWLAAEDYAKEHDDLLRRRQEGTGRWLLEAEEFKAWCVDGGQQGQQQTVLFCPGIPGAGKTILSTTVIDHLQTQFHGDPDIAVAYIYCNFRRHATQKLDDLVSNLLKQLAAARQSALPAAVKDLYDSTPKGKRPALDKVSAALRSVVSGYTKVCIVVDALDECASAEGCRGRFLAQLLELHSAAGNVRLFATSRPIPDVVAEFGRFPSLEIKASRDDVGRYLQGHMGELMPFVARSQDLQAKIVAEIADVADGMFLLAILFFQSLRDKATPKTVKRALDQMRKQTRTAAGEDQKLQVLRGAYDEAMERISGQPPGLRDLATRVLAWITCARRPLAVVELQHALAVEFDDEDDDDYDDDDDDGDDGDDSSDGELDTENLPEPDIMVSVCAGLVTVDADAGKDGGIIRLVHYTTQEYFEQTQSRWFPGAQLDMARTCARYLSYKAFASGRCQSRGDYKARGAAHPLFYYATKHWDHHARAADTACREVMAFLRRDAQVEAAVDRGRDYQWSWTPAHGRMSRIHLAARFGLDRALQELLLSPPGGGGGGGGGGGPADPDMLGQWDKTPLICAAEAGHEGTVRLLLATGRVNVNAITTGPLRLGARRKWSALHFAARNGHAGVARALLETGNVDVNSRNEEMDTPLAIAAQVGHDGVVRALLTGSEAVDVECWDIFGETPLRQACQAGHEAVVRTLLATGRVDINGRNYNMDTPLIMAAREGHERIVRILLATPKVDIDAQDSAGHTALSYASRRGHEGVVRMLLATGGVDVNVKVKFRFLGMEGCWTPAGLALMEGHTAVAELLRASGGLNISPKPSPRRSRSI